ncbi:MAG: 50S ribosomal protein L4 [Acidobacteriia bacterium]|nr:50S ribosomal protein L4 [Terriglobia bacterium]
MPIIEVKNLQNEVVGNLPLSDELFLGDVNEGLLWEVVKHYLASKRAGTHATKNRGAVRGGGKKPWRQKGTGRARVGSSRNPLWRHGGTAHGPQPRDYSFTLPKQKIRGALKSALRAKFNDHKLTVIDEFKLESHKTKSLASLLDNFKLAKDLLIVDSPGNTSLIRASRNLPDVKFCASGQVHTYDVLKYDHVFFSKQAITDLQKVLSGGGAKAA